MQDIEVLNNKLQLLGKLAASLAHEIRNPLSIIQLNLRYIEMSKDFEEIVESVKSCKEAVDRIQRLVENTLDFSRANSLEKKMVNLNEIINKACDIISLKAKMNDIFLLKLLDKNLPLVNVSFNKILQVYLNLMTNSIEAIGKRGRIIVSSRYLCEENVIYSEIIDNGKGILEEDKEKIFQDFFTSKSYGTGLGLGVCKRILEEHQADIGFESVYGEGARFYIKFMLTK
jgi:signal transduction histidine kinase